MSGIIFNFFLCLVFRRFHWVPKFEFQGGTLGVVLWVENKHAIFVFSIGPLLQINVTNDNKTSFFILEGIISSVVKIASMKLWSITEN